jgi:hypothetical protein
MTVVLDEFKSVKESVSTDDRGRIALGAAEREKTYAISRNAVGQILLTPVAMIPEYELWLWQNPAALAGVRQGLDDAASGRTKVVDFAAYESVETED